MSLPFRRLFYPLGFEVEILTNDFRVLEAAEESFGHSSSRYGSTDLHIRIGVTDEKVVAPPQEPIRREYDHLYSLVADRENHALLDLQSGANFTWINEGALTSQLYLRHQFLEKVVYLMLGAFVVTDIHAGCVSRNGKGILLCGDSGAGKSTLAYGCARAGWTYTSDDTVYLINSFESPRVVGHSHRVRFRPAAKELFSELEHHTVTPRMEGKPSIEVSLSDLPPMSSSPEAEVSAIVYLKRSSEAKRALVQLPRGIAPKRLSEELYSAGRIRAKHKKILRRFANIPTYELHYRALDEAIEMLENLTNEP